MNKDILNSGYDVPCLFNTENFSASLDCSCATIREDKDFVLYFHELVHSKGKVFTEMIK